MDKVRLTPKMLASLEALDSADGKVMSYGNLRRASGCKHRSFHSVFARIENANLAIREYDKVHITFAGIRTLANHRTEGTPMN